MQPQHFPAYPQLRAWSDHPHLNIDQLVQKFPALRALRNDFANKERDDRDEDEEEISHLLLADLEDRTIIMVDGDISVTQEQMDGLNYSLMLAVDGNLHVDGRPSNILYVSGDIYCNTISLDNAWLLHPVGGTIHARHCAWLWAEDHEDMCSAPVVKLETRFLFSWFYDIGNLALSADAAIFILADRDYCTSLDLPNPVFIWHDVVFVLKDRFVLQVDSEGSDAPDWRNDAIEAALQSGEDIFISGFDIRCTTQLKAAKEAMAARDYRSAYLLSKQAAALSPAYYKAWLGMGDALREAGAYEQALAPYQEAVKRFPVNQTALVNTAANNAALCAIRCRMLAQAIHLANVSIDHTQEGYYNGKLMANAYRLRAEACLLSGRQKDATADLVRANLLNPFHATANWLMGLVHYRNGAEQQARKCHKLAADRNADLVLYYDAADSTDFVSPKALSVDWDTQEPG